MPKKGKVFKYAVLPVILKLDYYLASIENDVTTLWIFQGAKRCPRAYQFTSSKTVLYPLSRSSLDLVQVPKFLVDLVNHSGAELNLVPTCT